MMAIMIIVFFIAASMVLFYRVVVLNFLIKLFHLCQRIRRLLMSLRYQMCAALWQWLKWVAILIAQPVNGLLIWPITRLTSMRKMKVLRCSVK